MIERSHGKAAHPTMTVLKNVCTYLGVCILAILPISSARAQGKKPSTGRWGGLTHANREKELHYMDSELEELVKELSSIGYLSGRVTPPDSTGILVYDKDRAEHGLNFVVSGHKPSAWLIDMSGSIIHQWNCTLQDVFPDGIPDDVPDGDSRHFWRRAHLYPNGDVLAIFDGMLLMKINAKSEIDWVYRRLAHHDIDVSDDGLIYTLVREIGLSPDINEKRPVLENFIAVLDRDGREIDRIRIFDALAQSDYKSLIGLFPDESDIMHTNTIEWLDGRGDHKVAAFAKGNLLLSLRAIGTILIINPETRKVVWAMGGALERSASTHYSGERKYFDL